MTPELHPTLRRLDDLADALSRDPSVLAVLGLGSAGEEWGRFDDHSDIDFFVVVADVEAKQRYLAATDWLGGFGGRVVFDFVNDANGRKALFADGLFLEYAVLTPSELGAIPVRGARVVWARPGTPGLPRTPAPPARSALDTVDFHVNEALTNLYVGLHRELRGERLAAMRFIQVHAVDRVLALVRLDPGSPWSQPDPFDTSRRVEAVAGDDRPPLEEMAPGYGANAEAAAAVLGWLSSRYPTPEALVSAIDALIVEARRARPGMRRPTLFLTVGLPGTGKTTAARRIERERGALRLTKDEWVKALYGDDNPASAGDVIEGRLVEVGLRALELGVDVVIDFGLWGRDERSALRQASVDRGARVEMCYLALPLDEQRARLDRRHREEPHTTWHMSADQLAGWSATFEVPTQGEQDGSEPIDDPPAGFGSWDAWRASRWPAAVS